jgi:hypothetical protein
MAFQCGWSLSTDLTSTNLHYKVMMKRIFVLVFLTTCAFAGDHNVIVKPFVKLGKLFRKPATTQATAPNAATAAAATPVGVVVQMSDGTTQTVTLGTWLTFQNNQLRVIFPTQYVNQPATLQGDGTWLYNRAGRNVQVWRNGVLQKVSVDYTLDQANMKITPIRQSFNNPDGTVTQIGWDATDLVQVAYIF